MPQPNISPRNNPPSASYKKIALTFIIIAIIVAMGISYLALSKVTITLVPKNEPLTRDFELTIAENPDNNTSTPAIIKGDIKTLTGDINSQYLVEGGEQIEDNATGEITIYNDRKESQLLVANTRFLTPAGLLFRLKNRITVPGGSTIKAAVYADAKGAAGNIEPSYFTIPGLSPDLQKLIYAKSDQPFNGGVKSITTISEADFAKASESLAKDKAAELVSQLMASLDAKTLLIGTKTALEDIAYSEKVGAKVGSFIVTAKINVAAILADKNKILTFAKTEFAKGDSNNSALSIDPSSLKYELLSLDLEKKEALAKISLTGLETLDPSKNIFDKNLLVGFTAEDLKLYFSQFNSIKEARVEFSPFWVKKVPLLKDHIIIEVEK
jgi:hypothetical protein